MALVVAAAGVGARRRAGERGRATAAVAAATGLPGLVLVPACAPFVRTTTKL